MSIKTDLAKEIIDRNFPEYSKKKTFFRGRTKITRILIDEEDAKLLNKPSGRYVTIEADSPRMLYGKFDEEAEAIAAELKELLPKSGDIIAVGFGNALLTADSLGVFASEKIIRHGREKRKIMVLAPGTESKTEMEPKRLALAAVKEFSPDAAILVDSLAAEDIKSICRTVQITNSGIAPGSGISERAAVNRDFLKIPTVAIGSPTVAKLSDAGFVSPKDIDVLVKRMALLIAAGISLAVFPELGIDFIKENLM